MLKTKDYTLLDAPAGTALKVIGINGGGAVRSRLCALGILPGAKLEVCANCPCGASRKVQVRGASLVIGAGMAEKVTCEILGTSTNPCLPQEYVCQTTLPEKKLPVTSHITCKY